MGGAENAVSDSERMTTMTLTRPPLAAALLAALLATSLGAGLPVQAAPAAADAAAAEPAPDGPRGHGPDDRDGRGPGGPEDGPGGGRFGMSGPGMPFGNLHGLALSEAQQDKLFAIMHAQAPQRREQEKALRKAGDGLRELGRAERFDEATAAALSRDLGQAVAAEALLRARTEAQVLAVLTPEQRARLRQHRERGPHGRPDAAQGQGPQAPQAAPAR